MTIPCWWRYSYMKATRTMRGAKPAKEGAQMNCGSGWPCSRHLVMNPLTFAGLPHPQNNREHRRLTLKYAPLGECSCGLGPINALLSTHWSNRETASARLDSVVSHRLFGCPLRTQAFSTPSV